MNYYDAAIYRSVYGEYPILAGIHLKQKFLDDFATFLNEFPIPLQKSQHIGQVLWQQMDNPRLHYHIHSHILFILEFAKKHKIELHTDEELAIWFHDSIYDPTVLLAGQNEHHSALFMESLLGSYLDKETIFCAKRLIRATGEHFSADIPPDSQKIVDLDVAHFSLPREKYKITTELLRLEYPMITDAAFDAGRKDFLTRFLAKGFIYRTDFFKEHFEAAARANIEQDLKEIK